MIIVLNIIRYSSFVVDKIFQRTYALINFYYLFLAVDKSCRKRSYQVPSILAWIEKPANRTWKWDFCNFDRRAVICWSRCSYSTLKTWSKFRTQIHQTVSFCVVAWPWSSRRSIWCRWVRTESQQLEREDQCINSMWNYLLLNALLWAFSLIYLVVPSTTRNQLKISQQWNCVVIILRVKLFTKYGNERIKT